MSKQEAPLIALQQYIPKDCFDGVLYYLQKYDIHLTITSKRTSILGDYRHSTANKNHRISINGNLNKYAFLITFLHELAHLFAFEKYGNRIKAHGKEWKYEFSKILSNFLSQKVFPNDIEEAILSNLKNPAASSCADENLMRVLYNYNNKKLGTVLLEQLPERALFKIEEGKVFKKGTKIRKRYECIEVKTGKYYLFSPVYEVIIVNAMDKNTVI